MLTSAMQNTLKQSAIVIAVSFHLVGYTKSSSFSSSKALACELRLDVFSATAFFSSAMAGWTMSLDPAVEGITVSTTPLCSSIDGLWLWVAVFSESAMLEGRRLFASLMSMAWVAVYMFDVRVCAKANVFADDRCI